MKKTLNIIALAALAGSLSAAEPQWLANIDGQAASIVAPSSWGSGNSLTGLGLGVEYQPNFRLSLGLGYNYLGFNGPNVNVGANVLGLKGKLFIYELSQSKVYLGGGAGYDLSDKNLIGSWQGHLDAGLRWRLHERVAVDTAVNYQFFTPAKNMIQAVGLSVAVVVPLDQPFGAVKPKAKDPVADVKLETPVEPQAATSTAKPEAKPKSAAKPSPKKK